MIRRDAEILNQGSMIIEVSLIMPVILMILVLLLTLLFSVFRQAEVHSALMTKYTMYENSRTEEKGKNTASEGKADAYGDRRIYSGKAEITWIQGYEISSVEQQIVRISDVEDKLRRWQMLGDLVPE